MVSGMFCYELDTTDVTLDGEETYLVKIIGLNKKSMYRLQIREGCNDAFIQALYNMVVQLFREGFTMIQRGNIMIHRIQPVGIIGDYHRHSVEVILRHVGKRQITPLQIIFRDNKKLTA
jgi:hypothetical protein